MMDAATLLVKDAQPEPLQRVTGDSGHAMNGRGISLPTRPQAPALR